MYRQQIRNMQGSELTSVIFVSLFIAIDFVHFLFIPLPTNGFEIKKSLLMFATLLYWGLKSLKILF